MLTVGDIFQVAAVGRCFAQRIIMTHYYRCVSTNPDVDEHQFTIDLGLAISNVPLLGGDVLETPYLALLPASYNLDYWRVQAINPVRRAYFNTPRNTPGTNENAATTVNLGIGITLRSNSVGRHEHSTKHIGPVPDNSGVMVGGLFVDSYKAIANTMTEAFKSSVFMAGTGTTMNPVIYNPGQVTPWAPVTQGFVGDTVRVQRRRTVGLGE